MHKKLLLLLIIPMLMIMTACSKPNEGEIQEKIITKTIELRDPKLGFTTTFKYDAEEKYSEVEEHEDGKATSIIFHNEQLEVEFEMRYEIMTVAKYNELEMINAKTSNYKEYTFGDYEAYAYGEEVEKDNLCVLLGIDDTTVEVLLVTINSTNPYEKITVSTLLEKESIKNLFSSMEFVKE